MPRSTKIMTTSVKLTARETIELEIWAERGFSNRQELAAKIIQQWLRSPARELLAGSVPCDLGVACEAQRSLIAEREGIVKGFRSAREAGRANGLKMHEVTRGFLRHLLQTQGKKVSRSTLHN